MIQNKKNEKKRLQRALSVNDVYEMAKPSYHLTGKWHEAFGDVDRTGIWIIWGKSGSGKTTFVLQLCKELAKFGRVAYDSLEEGDSLTMKNAFIRVGMKDVAKRVILLNREKMEDLHERLKRPKSPDIVVIDSLQYTQMRYKDYIRFKEAHTNKLIIFVSHAKENDYPKGGVAESVMYDATQKILVKGYIAFSKGRFFGKSERYVVWEERAKKIWGENLEEVINNK